MTLWKEEIPPMIDLDRFFLSLTPEEVRTVLEQALAYMSMDQKFNALDSCLTEIEKEEFVARWS